MKSAFNPKQLLLAGITAVLPAILFLDINIFISALAVIAQIGLYSALLSAPFNIWKLFVLPASYGLSYLVCGDPLTAAFALFYLPASLVIAFCIRKGLSRGMTVVLSSLTVGVTAFACVAVPAFIYGVAFSFDSVSAYISMVSQALAEKLVSGVPDSLFDETLTKANYQALMASGFKYFSLCFAVMFCNIAAFASTAITKRVLLYVEGGTGRLSVFAKEWLFVLSKPSAVMYIICYLCLLVGGETLTLPQQIAFNTLMTAIQCGIIVMAFSFLRERFRAYGFAAIFMYIVVFVFFGVSVAAMVLSGLGVIVTLRRKTKEDNKPCKS